MRIPRPAPGLAAAVVALLVALRGNGFVGIYVSPASVTSTASIDHCRLENNQFGLFAETGAQVTIRDSVVSGSSYTGLGAQGAPT
jgi:hypothetical protein